MGWLELLPLLKRLLPLLTRIAPMLEGIVVARSANGKDTEASLQRATRDLKAEFALAAEAGTEKHTALLHILAEHTEGLRDLDANVQKVYLASGRQDERMEAIEAQMRALRTVAIVSICLLLLCAALLLTVFLRP